MPSKCSKHRFEVENEFKDDHAFEEFEDESEFNDDQVEGRLNSSKMTMPLKSSSFRTFGSGNWDWSSSTTSPRLQADRVWKFGQDQLPDETVNISPL